MPGFGETLADATQLLFQARRLVAPLSVQLAQAFVRFVTEHTDHLVSINPLFHIRLPLTHHTPESRPSRLLGRAQRHPDVLPTGTGGYRIADQIRLPPS